MIRKRLFWNPLVETMTAQQLRNLQDRLVRSLVHYAYKNSPYYKCKFKELRIDPASIHGVLELKKLPYTTRKDIEEFPFNFCVLSQASITRVYCSGGTIGKPKMFFYTKDDFNIACDVAARSFVSCGIRKGDVVMIMQPFGIWSVGAVQVEGCSRIGAMAVPVGLYMDYKDLLHLTEKLHITTISGTPSNLCRFSDILINEGVTPSDLIIHKLIVSGEKLTRSQRRYLSDNWNAEVMDLYGSAETDIIAVECEEHNGLHTWLDQFVLELVDPKTGEQIDGEGEVGEVVVTTLSRRGTPLVRYRLGDLAEIHAGSCDCGRSHPRINVKGRVEDSVALRDGTKLYSYQVEKILEHFPTTTSNFQVIAEDVDGKDLLTFRIETNAPEEMKEKLGEELKKALLRVSIDFTDAIKSSLVAAPKIELLPPFSIELTPRGKMIRKFLDRRKLFE